MIEEKGVFIAPTDMDLRINIQKRLLQITTFGHIIHKLLHNLDFEAAVEYKNNARQMARLSIVIGDIATDK